ncbi:MAG TPA: acyclic terpene utilization AtuA family protein [Terriglobales bacterium]|nr:acyclic terpene utilization AtuA family protein [Terriglobales bacterium]
MSDILRIANCSGFYGDRLSAAREMVEGGPIDVLTGDYLAELTMMILFKDRMKNPQGGFARTFMRQMEEVLGTCVERGIKVVVNAGGLNPLGLAAEVDNLANRLGIRAKVAAIDGDDLLPRLGELQAQGHDLRHMDRGTPLAELQNQIVTANAYLGCWGIVEALNRGADVVICPRVTDAAVAIGPAAWKFGWQRTDWDRLAGGVVAGHIIECGAQCTGGNYSFFRDEVPGIGHIGFPIAEMHADGSFVVTKHPGTGGRVSVGTITAQLLYEIQSLRYLNPDVTTRFDTIQLAADGADRVRVFGVRGEPPPPTTKVCINYLGGYRNSMTFVLAGLEIEEKARLAESTLWELLGGREQFAETSAQLIRSDKPDPRTNDDTFAHLRVHVKDSDQKKVGRLFSNKAVEMALASYPGFFLTSPPGDASPYGVYWPALVPSELVEHRVHVGGETVAVAPLTPQPAVDVSPAPVDIPEPPSGPTERAPLGLLCGARSGDKGGNANVGLWTRDARAYAWLRSYLTLEKFRELIPDAEGLKVERYELPNLLSLNFIVVGLLGDGVAASTRSDPQAKSFGEYVRAKVVDVPRVLLGR